MTETMLSSTYDHAFACLSNGLDPETTSQEKALSFSSPCSAAELIKLNADRLPSVLRPYVDSIALEFDWLGYKKRNADLRHLNPRQLVEHYLEHGLSEPRGWNSQALLLDRRFAWCVQSGSDLHLKTRMQVIVHCFHYSVLCSQLHYLRILARLGARVHLFVANELISDAALNDVIALLQTGASQHSWKRVFNHGEDWSSFHSAASDGFFDDDGITFKIQTKLSSSLGEDGGASWIDEALGPLCSSYQAITNVLEAFRVSSCLIIGSQSVRRNGFGINPQQIDDICRILGLASHCEWSDTTFAAGSMFVARNYLIKDFYAALGHLDYSTRSSKGSQYCGRYVGHAIERVFFYYANHLQGCQAVQWLC